MDGFEEDDQEEEIYNQDKPNNYLKPTNPPQSGKLGITGQVPKTAKLDKVFELQNKDMEVSVNLSSSAHNSFGSSMKKDPREYVQE